MVAFYSMGIMNYCSHDPGCALVKVDGSNFDFIFAEEGFLSRKKKSYQFPLRSMKYCLDYFGINLERLDVLTLDFMDHQRAYRTSNNYRLLAGDFIRSRLNIDPIKIKYASSHHFAHALTAYWPSGFDDAAVLVVDGLGSKQQTHSVFHMNNTGKTDLLFEQKGVGIGALYSLGTSSLGFDSGEEGKVMGLAPYGKDHEEFDVSLPDLTGDFCGFVTDYSRQMVRNPSPSLRFKIRFPETKNSVYEPYFARFAFNLQAETERALSHLAKEALISTGSKNLCFAGGVALNCVANNYLQHLDELKGGFFVQPASGDTGIPLGLALSGLELSGIELSSLNSEKFRSRLRNPFSSDKSPLFNLYKDNLEQFVSSNNIKTRKFSACDIAEKITEGNVIALYSEGIEFGPRALGHRSFLADARTEQMKSILNQKIKHREPYRPFAPIVLVEDFEKYFISKVHEHPFMLQAPLCNDFARKTIPAVCHIDGSARVQTISKSGGKARQIIEEFKKITGISATVNTSFNDNDEPIVFTKLDALNAFLNCNADILILEDDVIDRKELTEIESLKVNLNILIDEFRNNYFETAIKELTKITTSSSSKEFYEFLYFNANLTRYYREERMQIRLIDFMFARDKLKLLYIDAYHADQLVKLAILTGNSFDDLVGRYSIINDDYQAAKIMKCPSDNLLYNFSAYSANTFLLGEGNQLSNFNSFYKISDKIINLDLSKVKNLDNFAHLSSLESITESYEHRLDKNIDQLFSQIGLSRQ
jgi:carbamoyltransferase